MEISSVNTALSALTLAEPNTLTSQTSLAMLDKALETSESLNNGLAKMMEHSVYPNLGGNTDVSV